MLFLSPHNWFAVSLTLLFTGTHQQKTKSGFWFVMVVGALVARTIWLYISRAKDKLSLLRRSRGLGLSFAEAICDGQFHLLLTCLA